MKGMLFVLSLLLVLGPGKSFAQDSTMSVPDNITLPKITQLNDVVRIGGDVLVKENERCQTAVAILGDAVIRGEVDQDAVVIGGSLTISGTIKGQAVVIGGTLNIEPGAKVTGGYVAVGGKANVDPDARITGEHVEIGAFMAGIFEGAKQWLKYCLFKGRLIAPELPWTILVFASFLVLALLLSALFRNVYSEGIRLAASRPGAVLLAGLLALIGVPILSFMLTVTVIGIPLIPFVHLLVFGLGLIGLFAILSRVGIYLMSSVAPAEKIPSVAAGILISVLLVLLAMTPFVGLLVIIFVKVMGTGAGVFAFIELVKPKNNSGSRSGRPGRSGSVSVNRPAAGAETGITTVKPTESGSDVHAEHGVEGNTEQQVPEQIESQAASQDVNEREPSITDSVHAGGLWERFAAAFIDFLLVAIVTRIIFAPFAWFTSFLHQSHDGGPFTVTLFLVYLILMWGLKGTTIGNIIFHLKIQRIDGKPVTWSVALIRGLGLVLSVAPLGLGFFWMAWDENKQTWHDKIAGTEVIRVPRGVNLVDR